MHESEIVAIPIKAVDPAIITVVVADTVALYGSGIRSVLDDQGDMKVLALVSSYHELLKTAKAATPDIVVADEHLFERRVDKIRWLSTLYPDLGLVILVNSEVADFCMNIVSAGVRGIVPRTASPDRLLRCARKVAQGGYGLSDRILYAYIKFHQDHPRPINANSKASDYSDDLFTEKELRTMQLLAMGYKIRAIAGILQTTEQVIKNKLSNLYGRLEVDGKSGLIEYLRKRDLIELAS